MIFYEIRFASADGNFVGKSPETDGRVVDILQNQLLHLLHGIFMGFRVIALAADIGNFRPDNKAVFITGIVKVLAVLIVGKPHRIGAKLRNQGGVCVMLFSGKGISLP